MFKKSEGRPNYFGRPFLNHISNLKLLAGKSALSFSKLANNVL